ncbi:hypothetical protein ACFFX0_11010 [Citricoccus parietis]|uniref:Uncharacterized protein n=1 Tax=Citricoccus parietis TaxID=592307 RepID=A0ABV5FZ67_9MICC
MTVPATSATIPRVRAKTYSTSAPTATVIPRAPECGSRSSSPVRPNTRATAHPVAAATGRKRARSFSQGKEGHKEGQEDEADKEAGSLPALGISRPVETAISQAATDRVSSRIKAAAADVGNRAAGSQPPVRSNQALATTTSPTAPASTAQ